MNPTYSRGANEPPKPRQDAIVAEVFPIVESAVPPLFAYRLTLTQGEWNTVGGKAAYRLRGLLPGVWVWSNPWLLTDVESSAAEIENAMRKLWEQDAEAFGAVTAIQEDKSASVGPFHKATFVARGLWDSRGVGTYCGSELDKLQQTFGAVRLTRQLSIRPWEVNRNPAVSLSVNSRLELLDDAWVVARKRGAESLVGSWAGDRFGDFKGQIVKNTGGLGESRERLLRFSPKPEIARILRAGDPMQPIYAVQGRIGARALEYPAEALRPVITLAELKHYGVSASAAQRQLRLSPADRAELIKRIAPIAKSAGLIGEAFATDRLAELRGALTSRYIAPDLRFGDGKRIAIEGLKVMQELTRRGAFHYNADWDSHTLRLGVVAAGVNPAKVKPWLERLLTDLKQVGLQLTVDALEEGPQLNLDNFHRAISKLVSRQPDAMLAIMPGAYRGDDADAEADVFYTTFKDETVGRGIASQVVYEATLGNTSARANILLGIFSKLGGVPYVLADPLPFADVVVGIDIGRRRKERLAGSINLAATTRIFANSGEFLRYRIYDAQIEGETIPREVLQRLLPRAELGGKRVVIHRDGIFRGEELQTLERWAAAIGATFLCCEIRKRHIPRIYRFRGGRALQAQKGDCLILNDREAFLVSTPPPFSSATPQPLHLVRHGEWTIEQAIESVLALSYLHHGSLLQPRLPVTVHYSDKIAYLALRGIKPHTLEGNRPYWL